MLIITHSIAHVNILVANRAFVNRPY